jgi:hypothetical protein
MQHRALHTPGARPSIEQLLDHEVDALDGLIAQVRGGIGNQRHFDELEEQANLIGQGLRDAFRKGRR